MKIFSRKLALGIAGVILGLPGIASAYIGPGAGFAFFTSFSTFFAVGLLAVIVIITWPVRHAYLRVRYGNRKKKKVVILGLDGLDPKIVQKYMEAGHLGNFKKLKEQGAFSNLGTTCPALSPVAWSAFITGAGPGRHNIFDFLAPDRRTYMPQLSSSKITESKKYLSLGKYKLPLGRAKIQGQRRGKPFWKVLGEKGYSSSILRVPISFPPEKFRGRLLGAMCIPDIYGTQGTFTFYTTEKKKAEKIEGGRVIHINKENGKVITAISGPKNSLLKKAPKSSVSLEIEDKGNGTASIRVCNQELTLRPKEYSPWVELTFPMSFGIKVRGICRFMITSLSPHLGLYITPIQIDPEKPAIPISYPANYATYLSLLNGPYATLGLAEDTWALNECVIEKEDFIKQAYLIHREREKMFFHEVSKVKSGVCACVFDITDRIQHMFLRDSTLNSKNNTKKDVILTLYKDMDALLGRLLERIEKKDLLMVISDHGFKTFERGVNLNSWLLANGYMFLKDDKKQSGEWFDGVDWSRTKAYALGLGGIFLNKKGRERNGIVPKKEVPKLCKEIQGKLKGLKDKEKNKVAVINVYLASEIYNGPYVINSPEIIAGFNETYRASWESAKGIANQNIFQENTKNWGGDHCIDPSLVPGVFFSNRKLKSRKPHIMDIGPTVLKEFGVKVPSFMEGKPLELVMEGK